MLLVLIVDDLLLRSNLAMYCNAVLCLTFRFNIYFNILVFHLLNNVCLLGQKYVHINRFGGDRFIRRAPSIDVSD